MEDSSDDEDVRRIEKLFAEREPSDEDLRRRIFTDEQAGELCRRLKCRVRMHWWNPVNDAKKRLLEEGRLQRKTPRAALHLLAKAVNRHKPHCLYDDDRIERACRQLRHDQLKDNLMLLDLWEYDRKEAEKAKQKEAAAAEENNNSIAQQSERPVEAPPRPQSDLDASGPCLLSITVDSLNTTNATTASCELADDVMREFDEVNTESLSLLANTEDLLTEPLPATQQSQPVLSQDFAELPLTSTQKQTQSPLG